ncbi:MAG: GntR family transcriptional regulator [Proteobacteria bacterium]|nr:GntR family transcriptional regulator [Pseudomonadota bacterium]MBU6425705.1 GntR family transcriptional regulator [Rhodospirillales bacterium]
MDIYGQQEEIRLDERQLSRDLGVSRTPIREALSLLEHEGFLRSIPRGGIFIVRKNKRELIEMVSIWSAIESMAARLACEKASDDEIAKLREIASFEKSPVQHVDEYAQSNMAFHRAIIAMSKCNLMVEITENLFIHMRAIRLAALRRGDRAEHSMAEHLGIVAALEARDPELSAQRVRDHTLGLAAHIEKYGDFLDQFETKTDARRTRSR